MAIQMRVEYDSKHKKYRISNIKELVSYLNSLTATSEELDGIIQEVNIKYQSIRDNLKTENKEDGSEIRQKYLAETYGHGDLQKAFVQVEVYYRNKTLFSKKNTQQTKSDTYRGPNKNKKEKPTIADTKPKTSPTVIKESPELTDQNAQIIPRFLKESHDTVVSPPIMEILNHVWKYDVSKDRIDKAKASRRLYAPVKSAVEKITADYPHLHQYDIISTLLYIGTSDLLADNNAIGNALDYLNDLDTTLCKVSYQVYNDDMMIFERLIQKTKAIAKTDPLYTAAIVAGIRSIGWNEYIDLSLKE